MSILLLLGNEPEKVKRHISRLTEEVNLPEMNILQVDGPIADENTIEFCYTSPLMSAQKLFIVKYDKLTTDPILQRILESNPSITTICVVAADIDKRSKISKLLKANTIKCNKFSLQEITKYINNTIEKQNLSATDEIIQEFILRTGYFENDTISFITLRNQLEQLCNYLVATHSKTVTMDIVDRLLPFTATTGIWKLLEVLEAGNSKLLFDSAHYLIHEDSNAIGIMSALAYNIRIAFKASFFGDISPYEIAKRLGVYNINSNPFLHYNSKKLSLMIDIIQDGIKSIKNGSNQMMILDIVLAKLLYVCKSAHDNNHNDTGGIYVRQKSSL